MNRNIKIVSGVLKGVIRYPFYKKKYCIKRGYKHRVNYVYYDNTPLKDEWQNEVYIEAKRIAEENGLDNIADFGCGSAYKLLKHFDKFKTIGVEVPETYKFLKDKYPDREWLNVYELSNNKHKADLIICSDVIEHVEEPIKLLDQIRNFEDLKFVLISTPERNILGGCYDFGPPKNPHHIREWSGWEFRQFISQYFEIVSHSITNYSQGTQLIICKPISE